MPIHTRYLGDLNGGQILRRLLARSLGLGPDSLAFYEFAEIVDPEGFQAGYRDALDRAGLEVPNPASVVEEAAVAFQLNIEVSEAVQAAVGGAAGAPARSD